MKILIRLYSEELLFKTPKEPKTSKTSKTSKEPLPKIPKSPKIPKESIPYLPIVPLLNLSIEPLPNLPIEPVLNLPIEPLPNLPKEPLPNIFHIVTLSPWPLTTTISITSVILSIVFKAENITILENFSPLLEEKDGLTISIFSLIFSIFNWFYDIIIEGSYQGEHTKRIQKGITLGFILFVISEVCVFFGLFFAYFYNSLIPSVFIGSIWPPIGIIALNWKSIPLYNTLLLLSSGVTITITQNEILSNNLKRTIIYLYSTLFFGITFLELQYFEFISSPFTIADSVFGSSFFILTGCHGLHIIIGLSLLSFTLFRLYFSSLLHPLQFSLAAIYWHFLDAVWLFIYIILYIWAF